ncbi:MAG: diguanylate cyclase, partial [Micromonosporaceae bacterium]|nr:diguanylate cyclase [Micromonosporaceae bacterium]
MFRPCVDVFDRSEGMVASVSLGQRLGVSVVLPYHPSGCRNNRIDPLPGGFPVSLSPLSTFSSPELARRWLEVVERSLYVLAPAAFGTAAVGDAHGWIAPQTGIAWAVGAVTVLATGLLVRRALALHAAAGSFDPCRGVGFLGLGVLVGGASLVAGALQGPRGAYVVAAGAAVSASMFILGLLLLPGAAPTVRARLRRLLDGTAIGLCLFFAGWTLIVSPVAGGAGASGRGATTAIVLVMALSATLAVTAIAGVRAVRHRSAALFCATGVAVMLIEHAIVALSLLVDVGWTLVLATTVAWVSGVVLVWVGARRSSRRALVPPPPGRPRRSGTLATLPLLSASATLGLLGAIYHVVAYGGFGQYTALIAVSAASSVAARGAYAALDLNRYARRLADQETQFRTTDPLTGIPNRLRLRHRLERERDTVQVGSRCGTLLAIDIDNFGEVDDMQGHDVGDAILMEAARRLRAATAPTDLIARLAGDSFAVLTPAPPDEADALATRLRDTLAEPYRPVGVEPGAAYLTVSVGVAECNAAASVDEMIRAAELAVASAKERGGNRVERYDESLQLRTLRRQTYAHEMRGALEGGELDLLYQPVVALPDGTPVGLQAQLRWLHPVLG